MIGDKAISRRSKLIVERVRRKVSTKGGDGDPVAGAARISRGRCRCRPHSFIIRSKRWCSAAPSSARPSPSELHRRLRRSARSRCRSGAIAPCFSNPSPVRSCRWLYESAELAKISINFCLVASISVANTLAEICEQVGANWSDIAPALKLDKRIGQGAYLSPGLGIAGGNLERDLHTILQIGAAKKTDVGVIKACLANSAHRKDWAWHVLQEQH
jgi:hypothetical protein